MNIADVLKTHARDRPEHPAIEDGGRVLGYGALERRVEAVAANLQAVGVAAGDVVGVLLPDSAEYLIVLLALARAGAVMHAIDGDLPAAEQRLSAESARLRFLIVAEAAQAVGDAQPILLGALCQPAGTVFAPPELGAEAPLLLVQSSGTTGAPKTFVWSHALMREQVPRHAAGLGWSADERYLVFVKMSFFWERELCLVLFCLGATVVVSPVRSLARLAPAVAAARITALALPAAQLVPLLALPFDGTPLFPGLRSLVVGSAPLPETRRRLARQRLTPNFYEQLGTNEAGLMVLGTPSDQAARPAAIGRVAKGLEARVLDDAGRVLPAGEVGLIGYRGASFPTGYLDNPEASARAFRDGWFFPGDLAAIDTAGFVIFKGRVDDVINNEGAKFYPIEVETALLAHPAVAEAAVFGWPDETRGEIAVALVVLNEPVATDRLIAFCGERIARHKQPAWVGVLREMPRTASGKILKRRLKEQFRERLAREKRG